MSARLRRIALAMLLASAAASPTEGCRQIAGIDDRAASQNAAACGFEAASACGACTTEACCAEESGCAGDTACTAAFKCLLGCADDACRVQCRLTHQDGFHDAEALVAGCQAHACQQACKLSCGGYVYPSEACATCATSDCCAEAAACAADSQCLALGYCARVCPAGEENGPCVAACKRDHLEGAEAAATFSKCLVSKCPKACGDPAWACLGKGTWPDPGVGDVTVVMQVYDAATTNPAPGVLVKACQSDDIQCDTPLASATADVIGKTPVMKVPAGRAAYFELSHTGYATTLVYQPVPVFYQPGIVPYQAGIVPVTYPSRTFSAVTPIDSTRGMVIANFATCELVTATGIALDADPSDGATRAYPNNGGWSTSLTDSGEAPQAVWVNLLAPRYITLTAHIVSIDAVLSSQTVIVRPGAVTWVSMQPPPSF